MVQELHIKGGPGSGKTTYGQNLVAEYIEDGAYRPREIMAMSFTRTAVAELVRRGILEEDNVGTIHSFGYRQLGSPPVLGGEKGRSGGVDVTRIWNETWPGFCLSNSKKNGYRDPDENGELPADDLMTLFSYLRNTMVDWSDWTRVDWSLFLKNHPELSGNILRVTTEAGIPMFWEKLQAFQYEHGSIDFTDMVEKPYHRDLGPPNMDARMVWVDEAQDLTPLQLRRIRQMARDCELLLFTYDDDQCLYPHLGADPTLLFKEKPPNGAIEALPVSHRMDRKITDYSQKWIRQNPDRIDVDYHSESDEDGEILKMDFSYMDSDVVGLASHVYEGDESLMILTSCGYMADVVASKLRDAGILFHNPYRVTNGRWNPLREDTQIAMYELAKGVHTAGTVKWWLDHFKTAGIVNNATKWKEELGKWPSMKPVMDETMVEIFRPHGLELFRQFNPDWLADISGSKATGGVELCVEILRKRGPEGLHDRPQIIVGTIHSVKGGEADGVLLFPDQSPAGANGDRAATLRQFYVGMTRAKHTLLLAEPTRFSARNGYCIEW